MELLRSLPLRTVLVSTFIFFSSLTAWAQSASVPARITQPVDLESLVTLRGNTHPLARPEFDRGAAPDSQPIRRMLLILQRSLEQEAELRRLLDEQQTKPSPNFHHWLTPQEFGQRFGPTDADIQAVTDWLISQGFEVSRVAAGRTVIEFSGTAGQVRQAFHTEIHKFELNGEEHFANTSDPQIPAALAPLIKGFASLNNFPRTPMIRRLGAFQRSKATGEVRPLFTYAISGGMVYPVGPTDFATIYNVLPLWNARIDGRGVTIAIVGESNINLQDVRDFRNMWGLPANDPAIILDGPDPGVLSGTPDETESDLDVEWSGAVAKGASIDFVISESTESSAGVDLSALYIIDNNLAPVMSESYSTCELFLGTGGNAFYSSLWEQASAQGITVMIAAGDQGSAACDSLPGETSAQYGAMVNGIASTPFNVAVGGTDFNDFGAWSTYWNSTNAPTTNSSALSYIPETTWNDSCARLGLDGQCPTSMTAGVTSDLTAGSGGPSNCTNGTISTLGPPPVFTCGGGYAKPSWQTGTGVPNDSVRDLPDVSLFASNGFSLSFYVICEVDLTAALGGSATSCDLNSPYTDFIGLGGTSASSPTFAGVMAMVNQKYGRQGNANYVLYKLAAQSGASCTSSANMAAGANTSSCTFYDVDDTVFPGVNSNNSVSCIIGTPHCNNIPTWTGYSILVTDVAGTSTTAAWTTGAGYDLATGLGSVNAANLVNNWTSVSFTPSKTTLSLSTTPVTNPLTLTHGQWVNVSIQVAPASGTGTPTGDASLIAQASNTGGSGSTTAAGAFTLSGGSAAGTTNLLPGGSYSVIAHYAGDATYGASDSSPVAVTVNPEASKTTVSLVTGLDPTTGQALSATTATYGSTYLLRVDVTNSAGTECSAAAIPCPTGKVSITDNGNPLGLGTYALNSQGYTEDQDVMVHQLPRGAHSIVASYAGDVSYSASISGTDAITIAPATTTTAADAPTTTTPGTNVILTAAVATQSNGAAPSGTLRFFNGSTPIGSPVAVTGTAGTFGCSPPACASAQATLTASFSSAGTENIMAKYSGDGNYAPSISGAITTTVTTAPDFNLTASPDSLSVAAGGTQTSTLTIAPLNGFKGAVTLSCSGAPVTVTCSASPASVTVSSSSSVTSTLSIITTASVPPLAPEHRVAPGFRLKVGLLWLGAGLLIFAVLIGLTAQRGDMPWPAPSRLVGPRLWNPSGQLASAWPAQRMALPGLFGMTLLVVGICAGCMSWGVGLNGGVPFVPAISISPTSITFTPPQGVGTTSAAQTVLVTDTGTAPLIANFGLSGTNPSDFSFDATGYSPWEPGESCWVTVTFTPRASGLRTASLEIYDNAAGSPQTISLSGTGEPPTPRGTYPLTVTATGSNLSHGTQITLTVQ